MSHFASTHVEIRPSSLETLTVDIYRLTVAWQERDDSEYRVPYRTARLERLRVHCAKFARIERGAKAIHSSDWVLLSLTKVHASVGYMLTRIIVGLFLTIAQGMCDHSPVRGESNRTCL